MTPTTLTDIQWINLNMLTAIRSGLQHDPAATCCKFGLDADQADHLRDLSLGELCGSGAGRRVGVDRLRAR